jgi:hypothetical protein
MSKNIHSEFTTKAAPVNLNTSVRVLLATNDTDKHLNLYIDRSRVTLTPEDAKRLRDELLKAYPLTNTVAASSTKFKVGDHVRVRTTRHGTDQYDTDGIVTKAGRLNTTLPYEVDFKNSRKRTYHRGINQYSEDDLELVAPAAPVVNNNGSFIVVLREDGKYKPNENPYIHYSRLTAEAEAERLAKLHGGTFHVLKATFVASRDVPVVPPVKTQQLL